METWKSFAKPRCTHKMALHLTLDFSPDFPPSIAITKQGQAEPDIFLKYLPCVFSFGLITHNSVLIKWISRGQSKSKHCIQSRTLHNACTEAAAASWCWTYCFFHPPPHLSLARVSVVFAAVAGNNVLSPGVGVEVGLCTPSSWNAIPIFWGNHMYARCLWAAPVASCYMVVA